MELRFGDYRLDPAEGLSHGARRLHVTPKSLSVLHVLVAHPGKVIGKDQLIREVWNGIAVSDSALTSCIKELRRALDDDAKHPRFIETLNRRGFRFIAAVTTARPPSDSHGLPSPIVSSGLFVGRDRPMNRLAELVQRAATGQRQVIFVSGEPGIGKTALVEAFVHTITRGGSWRLTHGQCVEHYGESEPYQPLLDAVARLCRDGDDAERFLAPLRHCAPSWLAQLPSLQAPEEVRMLERRTAGVTPQRMRRELVDALEAIATSAPIVLWLEDVHWSDLATLDWITDFAARPETARLVLIATCRTAEVRDGHPLRAMIDSLHVKGWCEEIVLGGLTEADVCRLIDIRLPGGGAAAERLGRMVNQHTDGNPLFVMNVIADLIARGVVAINEGRWVVDGAVAAASLGVPDDVRRTITRQIDRLTPRERGLLEVMTVLGGSCPAAAVAAGAGLSTTEVETTLGALAREHWLIGDAGGSQWPDGTQSAAFEFLHALYREVVGERLHAAGRVELHLRIGERLERAYATNIDEIAGELAVHFEEARDLARAIAYLQRAAETSRRRSAYAVAEAQLRRALALLEQLPISSRTERETEVRIALGSLLMAVRGWGSDEIETHYDRALDLCGELGPTRHLFPSLWGLWLFQWGRGDSRKAGELVARLRGQIDSTDSARVLQAYHAGWATFFSLGRLDEAKCHAAAGIGMYRIDRHASLASAYGNHDAGACALNFWARAAVLFGAVDEAVRQSDASLALARELGHPFTLALTLFFASTVHHARQDAESTRARASAGRVIANEHGFRLIAAWSSILEGWSLVQVGRQAEGLSLLRDALSAAAAGSGMFMTHFMAVFAEAQFACSQATEALRAVDEGLRLADRTGERFYESELYRLRGELTLRTGGSSATPAAEHDFLRACAVSREQNARWLFLRAATSLAAIAHGTVDGRVQLLTEALAGISEGLDLRDVRIARELLDRLHTDIGERQASRIQ